MNPSLEKELRFSYTSRWRIRKIDFKKYVLLNDIQKCGTVDLMKNTALDSQTISSKIYTIRGHRVMLDRDLAELYGVHTKRLNEQVKRNKKQG